MGTWGTAISSNDTYADIYSEFFDLYNEGLNVSEITKKLITKSKEIIDDESDSNNFWFTIAKAQWECKQLDKDVFIRVQKIIETGVDIEIWKQLGASEKDLKKRQLVLDKFLNDLKVEKTKAKSRKKKVIRQPVYQKGDCITFKLENGNYGGAVVLEAIRDTEFGDNLIATTRINQEAKPTKNDFESAEILIANFANWDDKPNIRWYMPLRHNQAAHLFEKVETIDIQIEHDPNKSMFGKMADLDIWIINEANQQFKSELTKPRPIAKQTIKELTKRNKWKLW